MNELIKILNHEDKKVVNARDLHESLGVGRDFSNWIKDRIEKYEFEEGEDYTKTQSPNLATGNGNHTGGSPTIEYFLTLNMAKEIAIVENNEKGRKIRRYLIKVEEAWNNPEAVKIRAGQMGLIPPQAMVPQISGGTHKQTISSDENFMDALWFYSIGIISRADLIRFRFGAAECPSENELELDPLTLSWAQRISAMRSLKSMKDDDFPLSRAKLEALLRGKPSPGGLIKHCAYETPHEKETSYSREVCFFLAKRYFEIYETGFEKDEFIRHPPTKAAYDQFKSNYQYHRTENLTPVYLWPNKSHKQIAELKYLFETGVCNRDRIKAELFENRLMESQMLPAN